MNSIAVSTSPILSIARRGCTKMTATNNNNKSATNHTRSPRSRYSLTYADWITRALMAAKDKCACLSDIYEWMSFNVPGLQEQRFLHSSKGWKNAVRHTLSINPRFQKLKRLGKPALWTLSEDYMRQAQALTKISMSIAPRRDSGDGIQMLVSPPNKSNMETCSNGPMEIDTTQSSPQSKICYIGKSTISPDPINHHTNLADLESKLDSSFNARMASLANSALFNDPYHRNTTFLNQANTVVNNGSIATPALIQACDAAAAANRAAFLSDLSALASLNALITANNAESMEAVIDPLRQRVSAEAAALAAVHGLGPSANNVPSTVSATPPLMNFFTPAANCPYNSISRRGSGDSGISSISNCSSSTQAPATSTMGGGVNMIDPLRSFSQSLDVTTLNGLEATLVLPRPLPIQCLTDHKLLLASLIWPNPGGYFNN